MTIPSLDAKDGARQRGEHGSRHAFASDVTDHDAQSILIEGDKVVEVAADFGSRQRSDRKLDAGDYSIEGFETVAAIQRKELNDYVQTVIYHRERFAKELKKLAAYRLKAIVVEASMADVLAGRYEGHVPPKSVIGATAGIILGFGVPVYFCSDRQIMMILHS